MYSPHVMWYPGNPLSTKHLTLLPPPLQAYLKEFNDLLGELKGKNVGIFGITAQSQADADKAVRDWGLQFQVSQVLILWLCCHHKSKLLDVFIAEE